MNKPKCFLDMDGVLSDFVGRITEVHQRPYPYLKEDSFGRFDIEKIWGISAEAFWKPTHYPTFWEELNKTEEADWIVQLAYDTFGEENVAILTAPSYDQYSVPGKRKWIKKHYPELEKKIIFTGAKGFIAGPNKFLIDDREKNLDEWWKALGIGIRVPRPWNYGWKDSNKVKETLENKIITEWAYF